MKHFEFVVEGLPKPAGSKKGFALKKNGAFTGRVAVVDACDKSAAWKADVRVAARRAYEGDVFADALEVWFLFVMPRPQSHYNKRGLKPTAPIYPTIRPDVLKLSRAVEDALKGIIYADDAQIVREHIEKRYAEGAPGVLVKIAEVENVVVPTPVQLALA